MRGFIFELVFQVEQAHLFARLSSAGIWFNAEYRDYSVAVRCRRSSLFYLSVPLTRITSLESCDKTWSEGFFQGGQSPRSLVSDPNAKQAAFQELVMKRFAQPAGQ